ncbi:MAG: thiamine-phosphate kinase [Flavobacteriales bacterium]|nr:thiamine-phosphate kinase [Flavobacteriales bacterium]
MKFTPISHKGEINLIKQLTQSFSAKNPSTCFTFGDDAAVLSYGKQDLILTTDTLTENVHFNLIYTPLKHLGYKAIVSSLSDVYAMNGCPKQVLVSIAVPNKYSVEMLQEIYTGINLACKNYNVDLIGGDTTASPQSLVINVTTIGLAQKNKIVYRNGAQPNDLLVVSGDLGGAYLGLQILEREKYIFQQNNQSQPSLEKYTAILERQLKPEARRDVIKELKELQIKPSAMIDISDGLGSEVNHLSQSSNIGFKVFEEKVPISQTSIETASELNISPLYCALHGGEDYELLFTVPLKWHKEISGMENVTIIGHSTEKSKGVELLTQDNEIVDLNGGGWDPFTKKSHI